MKKIKGIIITILSFILCIIIYPFYAIYSIIKSLTDMYEFMDFMEDFSNIVSRAKFNFQIMTSSKKRRNCIIDEIKNNATEEYKKGRISDNNMLFLQQFLKEIKIKK